MLSNAQEQCHTAGVLSRTLKANKMTTQTGVPQSPGVQKVARFRPRAIRNRNATGQQKAGKWASWINGQVVHGRVRAWI